MSLSSGLSKDIYLTGGKCNTYGQSLLDIDLLPIRSPYPEATSPVDDSDINEVSPLGTMYPDVDDNNCAERVVVLTARNTVAKEHDLVAGYCRTLNDDGRQQSSAVMIDNIPDNHSNLCETENMVEDEETDEMFGGIFDFPEGRYYNSFLPSV